MTHLRQAMLEELQRRNYATTTVLLLPQGRRAIRQVLSHVARINSIRATCARIRRICCASGSWGRGRSSSTSRALRFFFVKTLKRRYLLEDTPVSEGPAATPGRPDPRRKVLLV